MANTNAPRQARPLRRWLEIVGPTLCSVVVLLLAGATAHAGDADLAIPDLTKGKFHILGYEITAWNLLFGGACVIAGTLGISLYLRTQIHKLPAHRSMLNVAEVIFQTCKTYLIQQGKFLLMLFVLIAIAISYYLLAYGAVPEPGQPVPAGHMSPIATVILVLPFSLVGVDSPYSAACYGIRVNTYANGRTAVALPRRQPLQD